MGHIAVLIWYWKVCAVCRATKNPNRSTAGSPGYTAIPESSVQLLSMDVFPVPEVTVKSKFTDCVVLAVDCHTGYIVALPGTKTKKKDRRDKHGLELQAMTVAQAMIPHWLKVFDVAAVICSNRGTQLVAHGFAQCANTWVCGIFLCGPNGSPLAQDIPSESWLSRPRHLSHFL